MEAPSILVVDDVSHVNRMLQRVLECAGYVVRVAADGHDALSAIAQQPPGLILLDLQMPVMDGPTFASRLKERGFRIPIVVVTAALDPELWADEMRAAGHLAKPFRLIELFAVINDVYRLSTSGAPTSAIAMC